MKKSQQTISEELAALQEKALACSAQQDYSGALQYFIMMLDIEPEKPETMFNAGVMCDLIGETRTALQVIREAVQLEPAMAQAHFYLGTIHARLHEFRAAQGAFRDAIQHDIAHLDAYTGFREVSDSLGQSVLDAHTDIVFYVVGGRAFHGNSIDEGGIGGSESAVIYMTRALAKRGYRIRVFTNCDRPGVYHGVHYHDLVDFYIFNHFNTIPHFISARSVKPFQMQLNAQHKMLWIHDNPNVELTSDIVSHIDKIISVSNWHAQQWQQEFQLQSNQFYVSRNGVDGALFTNIPDSRRENRLIYTSQPQRGLDSLLNIFPKIRKRCPDAELHVFHYPAPDVENVLRNICVGKDMAGVVLRGSVEKSSLAEELGHAKAWVYPTTFLESSCIAAIEAQAAGTPIVCSRLAALAETVEHEKTGFLINGEPNSEEYQRQFVEKTITLLTEPDVWIAMHDAGRARAATYYPWSSIADEWITDLLTK